MAHAISLTRLLFIGKCITSQWHLFISTCLKCQFVVILLIFQVLTGIQVCNYPEFQNKSTKTKKPVLERELPDQPATVNQPGGESIHHNR